MVDKQEKHVGKQMTQQETNYFPPPFNVFFLTRGNLVSFTNIRIWIWNISWTASPIFV